MVQVKMDYIGEGTQPKSIKVEENEVKALEDTGLWRRSSKLNKVQKEEIKEKEGNE